MTKLEKLKAARDAARDTYEVALGAEYALHAEYAADSAVACAARDVGNATYAAFAAYDAAYKAELKKTQEEQTNDI
jgi:hypothetical protein